MKPQIEQKKCASYGIEMMLKFSNVFNQMSDLCRNAVLEFSKDLALNEEYQKFTKFRITDSTENQVIPIVKKTEDNKQKPSKKEESGDKDPFEKIRTRRNRGQIQVKKQILKPKNLQVEVRLQSSVVSHEEQSRTKKEIRTQKQPEEKLQKVIEERKPQLSPKPQRRKIKDPILEEKVENKEPLTKRVVKPTNKITLPLSDQENSSQPSDYKARAKRKLLSGQKGRGGKSRRKKGSQNPGQILPKRPINGFMRFFQQVKQDVKRKYKPKSLSQLSPLISLQWKKLTKQEQDKYNCIYHRELDQLKKDTEQQKKALKTNQKKDKAEDKDKQSEKVELKNEAEQEKEEQEDNQKVVQEEEGSSGGYSDNEDNEQVSGSAQSPGQETSSPQQKRQQSKQKRSFHKVKRPVQQKEAQTKKNNEGKDESISDLEQEDFSISEEQQQNSNSAQENSQSSPVVLPKKENRSSLNTADKRSENKRDQKLIVVSTANTRSSSHKNKE